MSEFDLGRHEEAIRMVHVRMDRFERAQSSMDGKIDKLLTQQAEKRGERKVIAAMATAAGGIGSLLITLVLKLWGANA